MSDESHALSRVPPSPPAEDGDYDAIHAAVMETARGRWFLHEYAKRNRNADTVLILAAIERMEAAIRGGAGLQQPPGLQSFRGELLDMAQAIARTRSQIPESGQGKPDPLPEHSAGTASVVAVSRAPAVPSDIFAAARRIREVAWTLRERGVEISTCDQIAALASSILGVSSLRNAGDSRAQKLSDVLQHLERRIHAMLDGNSADAPPPHAATTVLDVRPVRPGAAEGEGTAIAAAAATELPPEPASSIETSAEAEAEVEPMDEPSSDIRPAAPTAAAEQTESCVPLPAAIEQTNTDEAEPSVGAPMEATAESQAAAADEIDSSPAAPTETSQPPDGAAELASELEFEVTEIEPESKTREEASAEPVALELEPLVVVPAGARAQFIAEPVELELAPVAIIPAAACADPETETLPTTQLEWGSPLPPVATPATSVGSPPAGQTDLEPSASPVALPDVQTKGGSGVGDMSEMLALARAALPEPEPISPTSAAAPARAGEPQANPPLRKPPSDRLAAIRAMSENERIALFS